MYKLPTLLNSVAALFLLGCTQDVATLTPIQYVVANIEKTEIDGSLVPFEDPQSHLHGYKDVSGKILIPAEFYVAHNFNQHGIADVVLNSKKKLKNTWVKIDKSGKVLTHSYFFDNGPDYFLSGLSRFVEKGKIGFIDHKAQKVIPAQFDWASTFSFDSPVAVVCKGCKSDGLAEYPEMKGGKWGAIDSKGKIVVPLEYDGQHTSKPYTKDDTLTFSKNKKLFQVFQTQDGSYKIVENCKAE